MNGNGGVTTTYMPRPAGVQVREPREGSRVAIGVVESKFRGGDGSGGSGLCRRTSTVESSFATAPTALASAVASSNVGGFIFQLPAMIGVRMSTAPRVTAERRATDVFRTEGVNAEAPTSASARITARNILNARDCEW